MPKLTLSMDDWVIAKAHRIARRKRLSISKIVSSYIASLEEQIETQDKLPPITQKVLDMGIDLPQFPHNWDYRNELTNEIEKRLDIK
ncbi:MAG: hypothetical protein IJS08_00190 [Victivallales bacterium]|nr:hypothetical protein [Victivallales bacterium]